MCSRSVLVLALVCGLSVPMAAQDCTPQPVESLVWGQPGQALLPALADVSGFVPPDQVWLIRAAGIATDDGRPIEWMLQIDHKVASQNDACCWLVPLHRQTGTAAGTPVLALDRDVILIAGERLSARANGLGADKKLALLFVGWRFPASCTARLLGVAAASTSADLSAVVSAANSAAAALSALASSVPSSKE